MSNKSAVKPEQVGRKYETIRYGFVSRLVGGDGVWYGRTNYHTEAEATTEFDRSMKGARYEMVGGIAVDFGNKDDRTRYERKVVKIISQCEVLKVGIGKV